MPYFDLGVETRLFFTDDPARDGTAILGESPGPVSLNGTRAPSAPPPLVLVHGWCCDSHDWNFQIPAFLRRHRVIAVDLRGHGRSTGSKGLRPRILAADIAALLRELGVTASNRGVVAVGHSLGAMVASALAVEHPDLVRAVVAVEPAYGLPEADVERSARSLANLGEPGGVERLLRYLAALAGPDAPEHLTTWHRRRALGVPVDVAQAAFAGMWLDVDQFGRREQSDDYLAKRTCPVLSVYGERRADQAEWESGLSAGPSDEVHVLPGGHWLHQEHPEVFNSLVLGWLTRLSSTAGTH
ncbi:alpha/beta hydrolase [Frankia sp. Mgl5]|uniref:alpha/beta fold hydrolase n=1 Tax=Frankia sp. Mgl5 TaxID=2933793 RepID=UPI00200CA28F|nr:alpha/beta hydrolase [Frankia sp. Mgl5]MCK9926888.1 alpha/beta hydrolase [Frankia sp. Mgl5]